MYITPGGLCTLDECGKTEHVHVQCPKLCDTSAEVHVYIVTDLVIEGVMCMYTY